MIEKLKKLGLTGYEPMAYLTLLKLGEAKADEISINARIPIGRIYNVLSSLEEARLIRLPATPFGIIDGENLALDMRNPLNPGEILAMVSIRDTKLAEDFREKFFNIWEKAEAL